MAQYWSRKRAPDLVWWTLWMCSPDEMVEHAKRLGIRLNDGERLWGVADREATRCYFDDTACDAKLRALVRHELGHVFAWARGVEGHERANGKLHKAIDDIAESAEWWPRRPPPRE